MHAMVIDTPGGAENLREREVALPEIRTPGQIRVALRAAGVNPVDTKLRQRGTYFPDRQPTILGCDGAGVVESVGSGVTRFQPGDEVYLCNGGVGGPHGNYAEYIVVDERFAAKKPASLSFVEAAAAPLVLITAWESLYDRGRLEADAAVLVHGGSGGVGHVAIQLACLRGARVCTTVSSEAKAEFTRWLGAQRTIDYTQDDFVAAVRAWTDGRGADLILDTVGGETFARSIGATARYGDLVTLLQPPAETDWGEARRRNLRVGLELMLTPMLDDDVEEQQRQAEILAQCAARFDTGELRIHVAQTFPLAEAAHAHRALESGGVAGKVVLTIGR